MRIEKCVCERGRGGEGLKRVFIPIQEKSSASEVSDSVARVTVWRSIIVFLYTIFPI